MCGAHAAEVLHVRRFVLPDGHPFVAGYQVVTCGTCGAAYATPLPPQEAYEAFYRDRSKYADAATGTGGGVQPWDDARLADTARQLAELVPDRTAHVMDVGCGAGGLLRHLRQLGYSRLTGIDPAPACVAAVQAIDGVRGLVGSLFTLPATATPADCVVLSHVLEHVRDVGAAVDGLRAVVHRDGCVYAEVPDATRYADFLVAPYLDFNTEHINHFSVGTLRRLFATRGWQVTASGTKTIWSSPSTQYPCAWVAARPRHASDTPSTEEPDTTLRHALQRYVKASETLLSAISANCDRAQLAIREVFVWGTGQTTAILLAETPLGTTRVVAYTDSNPIYHGLTIAGVPVVPPEQLRERPEVPVVIGSLLHGAEIVTALTARRFPNPIIRLDFSIP